MSAYLARTLQDMGQQIVVINRGYKGRGGRSSQVVSDGQQVLLASLQSGDEAQMLARQLVSIPVMTGADRYRTGLAAIRRFKPDVIVLDDGFQHIQLQRDLDLVLLDRAAPLGNGHLLPRGTLREPVDVLKEADGFVLTRSNRGPATLHNYSDIVPPEKPLFQSSHRPHRFLKKCGAPQKVLGPGVGARTSDFGCLKGARVSAFSGIASNEDFQRVVFENGAELVDAHSFCDHHRYTLNELERIAAAAKRVEADFLITTEKDFVRLPGTFDWPLDLMVVGVEIDLGEQEASFREFLQDRLDI